MPAFVPLHTQDIGLILSYQCQSACRHCVYNGGPGWSEWMDLEEVQFALDVIQAIDPKIKVHFTGGEPFLNFPLLLQSARLASDLGFRSYVETNGGWCTDPTLTREHFEQLSDAGLGSILISCTPFHAEKIPLTRTLLAIDTAINVFGYQQVFVSQMQWIDQLWRFGSHTPISIDHFVESYGLGPAGVMLWEGFGMISGGRAGFNLSYLTNLDSISDLSVENCREEILFPSHLHFDLYGNIIPGDCGGISLGDWHHLHDDENEFLQENRPTIFKLLIESGPVGLVEFASGRSQFSPNKEGYAGKCHLCVDIRRHLAHVENFRELQPVHYYQLL